jgi:hypothetical protein
MTLTASIETNPVSSLQMEYKRQLDLYDWQTAMTRQFLDAQAQHIAGDIQSNASRVQFQLPESVLPAGETKACSIPGRQRNQSATRRSLPGVQTLLDSLLGKFLQLERSSDAGVCAGARLLRFTTAYGMVHHLLPDGRAVYYRAETGDEIPSQPATAAPRKPEADPVPFTPHALRFFLPQWVAFDEKDHLLTTNLQEAVACLGSMQAYLSLLGQAVSLDPYLVADETYQRKRTGMLGQLVNQGRALGRYEAREIVKGVQQRASQGSLNRGLTLVFSYFDDQHLALDTYSMKVIPFGRVMFLPAFVVLAARREAALISNHPRLNSSTRRHLLSLMAIFEQAFLASHP